jgi:hypothetical protein
MMIRIKPHTIALLILVPAVFLTALFYVNTPAIYDYPGFYRFVPVETYSSWFIVDAPFYPGKLIEVTASWCCGFLADRFTGALVITICFFLFVIFAEKACRTIGGKISPLFAYAPAVFFFLCFLYMINPLPDAIAGLLALLCILLYQAASRCTAPLRTVTAALLGSTLLLTAGSGSAYALFFLWCIVFELFTKRDTIAAFAVFAIAALLPIPVYLCAFPLPTVSDAYRAFLPATHGMTTFPTMLPLLFLASLFLPLFVAVAERSLVKIAQKLFERPPLFFRLHRNRLFRGVLLAVTVGLAAFGAVRFNRTPLLRVRADAALNEAMVAKQWDRLLDIARTIPSQSLTAPEVHLADRALYHQGTLLDRLFEFPQSKNTILLYPYTVSTRKTDRSWEMLWGGETWFELGLVNTAEHCALECIAQGYFPQGVRLLSSIYLTKNLPDAAQTCWQSLTMDRVHKKWADSQINRFKNNPAIETWPEVRTIRPFMIKQDFILSGNPPLSALAGENPENKMAFEFSVAWYLLQRNLDTLALQVPGFKEHSYVRLPRHFQEALALYATTSGIKPDLFGYTIDNSVIESFHRFYDIIYTRHGGNIQEAADEAARAFGDSYFFFFTYGRSAYGQIN